ncbi:7-cyano-7-deazaguanine synthase [bacterium HR36]|nr:7-cyano-7-deazaguanine synthase [bacterium HR36]
MQSRSLCVLVISSLRCRHKIMIAVSPMRWLAVEAKAVVLLSGGLDSATTLAVARSEGYAVYALTVDYGQRHRRELQAAQRVAESLGVVEHRIVRLDLRAIGGSALTDNIQVPKDRAMEEIEHGIPVTYVPARNTVLLGLALGYAEVVGAFDIFIGCNAIDYSGYPDCRPEFLRQFEALANVATKAGVEGLGVFRVHAPLLYLSKANIIREGKRLGVNFRLTHSCYEPTEEGLACGRCDSCRLRLKGFLEAQERDSIGYAYVPPEYSAAVAVAEKPRKAGR